jgi:hypothetical protein
LHVASLGTLKRYAPDILAYNKTAMHSEVEIVRMENKKESPKFVVCIRNDGYQASLERRKIYQVVADTDAQKHQLIRVIDESGEDYLFPSNFFSPISLPQSLVKELS